MLLHGLLVCQLKLLLAHSFLLMGDGHFDCMHSHFGEVSVREGLILFISEQVISLFRYKPLFESLEYFSDRLVIFSIGSRAYKILIHSSKSHLFSYLISECPVCSE